jgi:Carbohydrate-selective porin, OprB family/S-layer homology domain
MTLRFMTLRFMTLRSLFSWLVRSLPIGSIAIGSIVPRAIGSTPHRPPDPAFPIPTDLAPIDSTVPDQFTLDQFTAQITSVSQLSDVQPTDWAFPALQSLVERYGTIAGYPDRRFRGHRALSRHEFAAGLQAVMTRIEELIAAGHSDRLRPEDLQRLNQLQQNFSVELQALGDRTRSVEDRLAVIERQTFSTTTKLTGQVVIAFNAGGFTGDRIIAPRGALISANQPNATLLYRFSTDFNTSFRGNDLLKLRLVTGSDGATDNATGFLEQSFGSALDFSIPGRNNRVSLARAYYSFPLHRNLKLTIGSALVAPDFVDKNRYGNVSFLDFSTQSLVNNYILMPRPGGAGAVLDWHPGGGAWKVRGLYVAGDATNRLPENSQVLGGGGVNDIRLFPTAGGGADGGFFGDPYMGLVEVEYSPSKVFELRLQYSLGKIFGSDFGIFGVNAAVALNDRIGLFGRYGTGKYEATSLGDFYPQYWSAGITFQNLGLKRSLAGLAIGQPVIESSAGNATQTVLEAFYNVPINDRLRITPLLQVIRHAGNREENGTIFSGTVRTVFSF